jgi:hypothetical protein
MERHAMENSILGRVYSIVVRISILETTMVFTLLLLAMSRGHVEFARIPLERAWGD